MIEFKASFSLSSQLCIGCDLPNPLDCVRKVGALVFKCTDMCMCVQYKYNFSFLSSTVVNHSLDLVHQYVVSYMTKASKKLHIEKY